MTRISRTLALGAALLMGAITGGQAADLGFPTRDWRAGGLKDGPGWMSEPPVERRWYFRADVGYSFSGDPSTTEGSFLWSSATCGSTWDPAIGATVATNECAHSQESLDNTWIVGAGLGYYFSPRLRGDLTLEYRFAADYSSVDAWNATHTTEISSLVGLANFYFDLGDRSGFSPYVGFGVGFAHNRTSDRTKICTNSCPRTGEGAANTSLAAAAMIGFTQAVRTGFALDLGYRFLYLGNARTADDLGTGSDPSGELDIANLYAHEIRLGFRYDF